MDKQFQVVFVGHSLECALCLNSLSLTSNLIMGHSAYYLVTVLVCCFTNKHINCDLFNFVINWYNLLGC